MNLEELADLTYRLRWAGQRSEEDSVRNAADVVKHLGSSTKVARISAASIQNMVVSMLGVLSSSTVNRKLAALSGMLSVAEERGLIKERPRWKNLKEPARRDRVLADDEVDAMVALVAHYGGEGYGRLVRFLAETGCRVGEALKLTWGDLRSSDIGFPPIEATFRASKNGRTRTIPFTDQATASIAKNSGTGPFTRATASKLAKAWTKARADLGLSQEPGFVPHALRHTCATKLVSRGVPLPQVMRWLGHTSIHSTMRYEHARTGELEGAREALER